MVILHTQTKATLQDHGSDSCCVASLMALIFLAKILVYLLSTCV